MQWEELDAWHMARALELAARGEGLVEPNPMVGCTIVRDGENVGEGFHARFGGPHAEIEALRSAGPQAAGATAYVTLEPCCHQGKTPPCTQALIQARIRRVVIAQEDPYPEVAGQADRRTPSGGDRSRRRAGRSGSPAAQCAVPDARRARPPLGDRQMGHDTRWQARPRARATAAGFRARRRAAWCIGCVDGWMQSWSADARRNWTIRC